MNIEEAFENAGCKPGDLKLVIITHGDLDHTGNCAFLQNKYRTRMHYIGVN